MTSLPAQLPRSNRVIFIPRQKLFRVKKKSGLKFLLVIEPGSVAPVFGFGQTKDRSASASVNF